MSIDKQRVAAVAALEALGFKYTSDAVGSGQSTADARPLVELYLTSPQKQTQCTRFLRADVLMGASSSPAPHLGEASADRRRLAARAQVRRLPPAGGQVGSDGAPLRPSLSCWSNSPSAPWRRLSGLTRRPGAHSCSKREGSVQAPVGCPEPRPSTTPRRSSAPFARRLRPSKWAPCSIANDMWWISPSTCDEACKATVCPQMTPETVPRTTICRPATIPVTLPFSPTTTSAACTSPSISPST